MSLFNVFDIAGSALDAQTVRMNTTASNMANANSAASSSGETYRARQPVFTTLVSDELGAMGAQLGGVAIDAIVEDPGNEPVANAVSYIATGLLRELAWSGIVYGALIALFAAALGAGRIATSVRRTLAPAFNGGTGSAVAAGAPLLSK